MIIFAHDACFCSLGISVSLLVHADYAVKNVDYSGFIENVLVNPVRCTSSEQESFVKKKRKNL